MRKIFLILYVMSLFAVFDAHAMLIESEIRNTKNSKIVTIRAGNKITFNKSRVFVKNIGYLKGKSEWTILKGGDYKFQLSSRFFNHGLSLHVNRSATQQNFQLPLPEDGVRVSLEKGDSIHFVSNTDIRFRRYTVSIRLPLD